MQTNELMIGDWLIPYNEIEPRKVVSLGYQYDMAGKYDCVAFEGTPHTLNYTGFCKPIPLTPEILEKNGFVKLWNQYVLKADKEPFIHLISLDNLPNANGRMLVAIKDRYTNAKIAITYVHELQHALRSCKIEKENKL